MKDKLGLKMKDQLGLKMNMSEDDKIILNWVRNYAHRYENDQECEYIFRIGDFGELTISIKAFPENAIDPLPKDKVTSNNLEDYATIFIRVFDSVNPKLENFPTKEEIMAKNPNLNFEEIDAYHNSIFKINKPELSLEDKMISISNQQIHVDNDVDWHSFKQSINLISDDRFSAQSWAQDKEITKLIVGALGNMTYVEAAPSVICTVIKYCYTISGLKLFW